MWRSLEMVIQEVHPDQVESRHQLAALKAAILPTADELDVLHDQRVSVRDRGPRLRVLLWRVRRLFRGGRPSLSRGCPPPPSFSRSLGKHRLRLLRLRVWSARGVFLAEGRLRCVCGGGLLPRLGGSCAVAFALQRHVGRGRSKSLSRGRLGRFLRLSLLCRGLLLSGTNPRERVSACSNVGVGLPARSCCLASGKTTPRASSRAEEKSLSTERLSRASSSRCSFVEEYSSGDAGAGKVGSGDASSAGTSAGAAGRSAFFRPISSLGPLSLVSVGRAASVRSRGLAPPFAA